MQYTPQDGFPYYYALAGDLDAYMLFNDGSTESFLRSIPEEKASYRYAPSKWSIRQVVGHITDHERIKMYRAFTLSRSEPTELWGYDQDALVQNSRFDELSYDQLLTDYHNVRQASLSFVSTLSEEQLRTTGAARQYTISLEDFLKSIIGHELHHIRILRERYF